MTVDQQEKWLEEKCKELRRDREPDLQKEWQHHRDEFYRHVRGHSRPSDLWRLFSSAGRR